MVLWEKRSPPCLPPQKGTVPEVVCIVLGPSVPAAQTPRVSQRPGEHLCVALRESPTGEAGPALLFCLCVPPSSASS